MFLEVHQGCFESGGPAGDPVSVDREAGAATAAGAAERFGHHQVDGDSVRADP